MKKFSAIIFGLIIVLMFSCLPSYGNDSCPPKVKWSVLKKFHLHKVYVTTCPKQEDRITNKKNRKCPALTRQYSDKANKLLSRYHKSKKRNTIISRHRIDRVNGKYHKRVSHPRFREEKYSLDYNPGLHNIS